MTTSALLKPRHALEIKDVEQPLREYAISRGWLFEKVTSASRKGWPDRFAVRKGRVVLIELKRPGEEPNVQQLKRHRELRAYGLEVVWFNDLEAAKAFLL